MMKQCSKCGEWKPYDGSAKQKSKARGFKGRVCWACYLDSQREVKRKARSTEAGRTKSNAANVKSCVKRYQTDAHFRLKKQLAVETNRLIHLLAEGKGHRASYGLFGATRETVFQHIDDQLKSRGFAWSGYGVEWVLDHRLPLGLAQSDVELYQLCRLDNCQVLTPQENQLKGAEDKRLIHEYESEV